REDRRGLPSLPPSPPRPGMERDLRASRPGHGGRPPRGRGAHLEPRPGEASRDGDRAVALHGGNRVKSYVALFFAGLSCAIGETFMSYGMRRFGAMDWSSPGRIVDLVLVVARNPFVLLGALFAAGFFYLYLSALSWADLSFAMPLTSLSFIF